MYHSLLVPLDGSSFAEHALPLALHIAQRAGASLHLAVVVSDPEAPALKARVSTVVQAWQEYLGRIAERVHSVAALPINTIILHGDAAAPQISAYAASARIDLVVMTTHGRGALGRFWFGSVAYELLHWLPTPLLQVKPNDGPVAWEHAPALQHIILPLDGSLLAEQILESAVTFGSLMGAGYTLLRVISDIPLGTPMLDSISLSAATSQLLAEVRTVQEQVRKAAQDYLEATAARLRTRGLRVQTRVVEGSDPGNAILDAAQVDTDLIALETQGRRGLSDMLLGSVARKIIHGAPVPILVQSATALKHKV